ncbi:Spherulation-specific family 4-domain-containing protein [Aspergillus egyptiacus]|nr:Spherulation-specific family 4-domain-containing protein [Aspergillus egyptiacus]
MEALHHPRRCGMSALHGKVQLRRRWWVTIGAAVGIVIILVIVIPLAILLPQRSNNAGEPSSVIFPLYIYPETNSTWDPLYEVIATHPDLNFLVVVNPQSGPGSLAHPGEEYQGAIRQLARYPNVQSVGYVPIRYSERQIAEVLDDIATYSGWHAQSAELAMAGIFFDESPHQYSDEAFNYLTRITRAVKEAPGLQRDQTVSVSERG